MAKAGILSDRLFSIMRLQELTVLNQRPDAQNSVEFVCNEPTIAIGLSGVRVLRGFVSR